MADLEDNPLEQMKRINLEYAISRIQLAEEFEDIYPDSACAWYLKAERWLDDYLVNNFKFWRDALENNPEHPISLQFLPHYQEIMAGYSRIEKTKG